MNVWEMTADYLYVLAPSGIRHYSNFIKLSFENTPPGVRHQCGQLNVNLRQVPAQVNGLNNLRLNEPPVR